MDNAGAIEGLTAVVNLIKEGVLPKGSTQDVMEQKMAGGELATMVNGPWTWANLRKSGIDFELAALPGVGGNPGQTVRRRLVRAHQPLKPEHRVRDAIS